MQLCCCCCCCCYAAAQRAGGASPAEAEVLRNLTEVAAGLGVAVEGEDGVQGEVAVGAAEGEEASIPAQTCWSTTSLCGGHDYDAPNASGSVPREAAP